MSFIRIYSNVFPNDSEQIMNKRCKNSSFKMHPIMRCSEHPIRLSVEERMTKISWKDELCCFITNLINNQSSRKKFSIHPVEENHAPTSHTTWFKESWRISVPPSDAPCLSFYLREIPRHHDQFLEGFNEEDVKPCLVNLNHIKIHIKDLPVHPSLLIDTRKIVKSI